MKSYDDNIDERKEIYVPGNPVFLYGPVKELIGALHRCLGSFHAPFATTHLEPVQISPIVDLWPMDKCRAISVQRRRARCTFFCLSLRAISNKSHRGRQKKKKKRGQKCEAEKNKRGRNRGPVQWSLARTLTAACRTSVRCPPVCFLALIVQRPGAISTVPPTGSGSGSTGKTESDYEKGPGIESRKLAGDTSARRLAFWQR